MIETSDSVTINNIPYLISKYVVIKPIPEIQTNIIIEIILYFLDSLELITLFAFFTGANINIDGNDRAINAISIINK